MNANLKTYLIRTINDLEERCSDELSPKVFPMVLRENQAAVEYALDDSSDPGLASYRLRAAARLMRQLLGDHSL